MERKKIKIAISIPIHEAVDVACNQVDNIQKYVPGAIVIFHASRSIENDFRLEELKKKNNVIINPQHLQTGWGGITEAHISNFQYLDKNADFDYFVMHSSNDMYVRRGLEDYIMNYEAGFQRRNIEFEQSLWIIAALAREDSCLKKIKGPGVAYASQIEGSFYSRAVMGEIVEKLSNYVPFASCNKAYPREELFFSTIASGLVDTEKAGKPTTFSEVHRFDRVFQQYYAKSNVLFHQNRNNSIKLLVDEFVRRCMFRSKFYGLSINDINHIRNKDYGYIEQRGVIDDGQGTFRLYDGEGIFSVKRVPRSMSNRLRRYINKLPN